MRIGRPADKGARHSFPHPSMTITDDDVMKIELTQALVRELLHYDPESGFLLWKERPVRYFKSERARMRWNNQFAGKRAGTIKRKAQGYARRKLKIFDKEYFEHRIIWLLVTGEQAPDSIDHINRDATDNRWSNLRDGTVINPLSRSLYVSNKSGVSGVSWSKRDGKWLARVKAGNKYKFLGLHSDRMGAVEAVSQFRKSVGFDETHGDSLAPYHSCN